MHSFKPCFSIADGTAIDNLRMDRGCDVLAFNFEFSRSLEILFHVAGKQDAKNRRFQYTL